jgi:hypothetical protein
MNNIIESEDIEKRIYEIRGKQVMLDSDLAELYQCKNGTKEINQAVKNNLMKFPDRFSWILSNDEYNILRSKFLTSSLKINNYGGRRYNPRVFTEQGVAMLATILKSDVAVRVSIAIMDAFVAMRHYLGNTEYRIANLETKMIDCDNNVKQLQLAFDKFKEKDEIYLNTNELDAFQEIINICKQANKELIIIDRFIESDIFSIIKRIKCNVILITSKNSKLSNKEMDKYDNLKVYYNDTFHDRYIIIDKNTINHSGNSINHIGFRKSSINLLNDTNIKKTILDDINKILYDIEI